MKFVRKISSIVLILVLLIGFMPDTVFADTNHLPAAQIDDRQYTTLQEAVDAVRTGETIYLLKDVTENVISMSTAGENPVDYTLDMQGHIISAKNAGSVYYIQGTEQNYVSVTIKNGTLTGGTYGSLRDDISNCGGGIYIDGYCNKISLEDLVISGNSSYSSGGGIYVNGETELSITNCRITDNELEDNDSNGGGIYIENSTLRVDNTTIEGNKAALGDGGGIYMNCSTAAISNSVITNNTASSGGGIYVWNGSLTMDSGAVYVNTASSGDNSNDLYISSYYNDSQYKSGQIDLLKADEMSADGVSFDSYAWNTVYRLKTYNLTEQRYDYTVVGEVYNTDKIEKYKDNSDTQQYITAEYYVAQNVARIGDSLYTDLQAAVDAAKDGDEIVLIADGNNGNKTIWIYPVTIDKNITINMNGRTVKDYEDDAFILEEDKELTIKGEGIIDGTLVHNGRNLTLDGKLKIDTIRLASSDRFITFGNDYVCGSQTLNLALSDELTEQLNTFQTIVSDDILIGKNVSEDVKEKIKLSGVTGSLISLLLDNANNLHIHKDKVKGVFLNGTDGNDDNTGLSVDAPVRTFAQAKQILDMYPKLDTVYVTGQITTDENAAYDLDGRKLIRYPEYKGVLIELINGAEITLTDIVIDGAGEEGLSDVRSMIKVDSGAALTIDKGAILQNNDISQYNSDNVTERSGGAVSSVGTLTMNDGIVQNCSAVNGGGIYCESGIFTLNGGEIKNNSNYQIISNRTSGYIQPSGGGVMINGNARMVMKGGTIAENDAYDGGGIAIGGDWSIDPAVYGGTNGADHFEMIGGTIENNAATVCGGGIFIQSLFTATIKSGTISKNESLGDGSFGGGGIYVNGGKETADGLLRIYDVMIADNTAETEGGGIAACYTAKIESYVSDSSIIYDNTAGENKDDILIADMNGAGAIVNGDTEKYISAYMLGGAPYYWKYTGTDNAVDVNELQQEGSISIYTDKTDDDKGVQTARSLATVFITENSSQSSGGGIASNGDVIIGNSSMDLSAETDNLQVTTAQGDTQNDNESNDTENVRPSAILVWLLRNGDSARLYRYQEMIHIPPF
jgi:predicted outer membrane repeat protein